MLNRKTCDFVGRMPVYTSAWQREGQRCAANFPISVMEKPLDKVRGWEEESSTPCLLTVPVMLHEWQRERGAEIYLQTVPVMLHEWQREREKYLQTEPVMLQNWQREREREGGRDISPDIAINAKMHRQKEDMRNSEFIFIFKALVLVKACLVILKSLCLLRVSYSKPS